MNFRHCRCGNGTKTNAFLPRRAMEIGGWVASGATLVLLPKCPACVAGYIALATGIGVSLPAAAWLRTALIMLCVGSLVFLGAKRLHRFSRNSR